MANKSEAEEVVGELCAFAPNTEIRDCIRLYAIDKSVPLIKAALMRKTKPTITSSLDYLGLSLEWNDYKKPDLVMVLLNRIRNLLPEECSVCNEMYRVIKDEPVVLPCEKCGQDIHKACIRKILRVGEEDVLSSTQVSKLINPFGLPFICYLCGTCQKTMLHNEQQPKKDVSIEILAEDTQVVDSQIEETQVNVTQIDPYVVNDTHLQVEAVNDVDSLSHNNNNNNNNNNKASSDEDEDLNDDDEEEDEEDEIFSVSSAIKLTRNPSLKQSLNKSSKVKSFSHFSKNHHPFPIRPEIIVNGDPHSKPCSVDNLRGSKKGFDKGDIPNERKEVKKDKPTCRYYAKGLCKHGTRGNKCKFDHPKACPKLLKHGNRAKFGCNKGKDCNFFHPKMCSSSLQKGVCNIAGCTLKHVKGTKQDSTQNVKGPFNDDTKNTNRVSGKHSINQEESSNNNNNMQTHFLDAIRLLKTELMEAMDKKIMAITCQLTNPVPSQPQHQIQGSLQQQTGIPGQWQYPHQHPPYHPQLNPMRWC